MYLTFQLVQEFPMNILSTDCNSHVLASMHIKHLMAICLIGKLHVYRISIYSTVQYFPLNWLPPQSVTQKTITGIYSEYIYENNKYFYGHYTGQPMTANIPN